MRIVDNTAKILQEVDRRTSAGLQEIGTDIEKTAKRLVVKKSGDLQRSITAEVSKNRVVIGSPLIYAAEIEANKPYLRPALEAAKVKLRRVFRVR